MRRCAWLLALLLPACGEDSSDEEATLGVALERHPAPGATLTYPNGHPLEWVTEDPAVLSFEDQVFSLVNQHRSAMSLTPLVHDDGLRRCSRGHARHMRPDVHDFVAHVNPEGHGPSERVMLCGVPGVMSAGENAAAGLGTPFNVFNAWMNSPGHRANIEEPMYRRSGLGYDPGPPGDPMGHYWAQLFAP